MIIYPGRILDEKNHWWFWHALKIRSPIIGGWFYMILRYPFSKTPRLLVKLYVYTPLFILINDNYSWEIMGGWLKPNDKVNTVPWTLRTLRKRRLLKPGCGLVKRWIQTLSWRMAGWPHSPNRQRYTQALWCPCPPFSKRRLASWPNSNLKDPISRKLNHLKPSQRTVL